MGSSKILRQLGFDLYTTEEQILNTLKKLSLGGRKFEPPELIERIQYRLPLPLDVEVVDHLPKAETHRGLAQTQSYGGIQYQAAERRMKLVYLADMGQMEREDVLLHEAAHIIRRHAIPVNRKVGHSGSHIQFVRPPGVTNPFRCWLSLQPFERKQAEARELIRFYEQDAMISAKHLWLASRNGLDVYRRDEKLLGMC